MPDSAYLLNVLNIVGVFKKTQKTTTLAAAVVKPWVAAVLLA